MTPEMIEQWAREAGLAEFGGCTEANIQRFASLAFAAGAEAMRRDAARTAAIHSQYPATTEHDRGYGDGRRQAADAIRALPIPTE